MTDGQQEPLIFIHGSGDTARCWAPVVQLLDAPSDRVRCLDLPGHGALAGASMDGLDDVAAYSKAVLNDMREHDIGPAFLIGHSLGTAIALQLALEAPERVRRLVLIGGGARLRVLPALLDDARAQPAGALRRIIVLGHAPEHEALAESYAAAAGPTSPEALYRDLHACDLFNVSDRLAEVSQPTLVLVGSEDRLTPPKYATYLAEHIPHATLKVIPGAGHYLMHEAPDQVAQALRGWLGS